MKNNTINNFFGLIEEIILAAAIIFLGLIISTFIFEII